MRFGSRNKGNKAELEIAALLQAWWRQVEPGCVFCRVPLSGGWRTPQHRESFDLAGDLMSDAKSFPWVPEIKRREGWSEDTLRAGRPSPVFGWWKQAQVAARELGKHPALFFRKNRSPWLLMLPLDYVMAHPVSPKYPGPWAIWAARGPQRLPRARHGGIQPVVFAAEAILSLDPRSFVE